MEHQRRLLSRRWPDDKVFTFDIRHLFEIDLHAVPNVDANTQTIYSPQFSDPNHDMQFTLSLKLVTHDNVADNNRLDVELSCHRGKLIKGEIYFKSSLEWDDVLVDTYHFNSRNDSFPGKRGTETEVIYSAPYPHHAMRFRRSFYFDFNASLLYVKSTEFIENQRELLSSGKNSNVTIVVGSVELKAHIGFLCAQSAVIKAMFNNTTTLEAQSNTIVIPDTHPNVMKDFLLYVYTGERPEYAAMTPALLTLADKYQVDGLKEHCEKHLGEKLTIETVFWRYRLAKLYSAAILQQMCLSFMADNFGELTLTDNWEKMCNEGGADITEITRFISKILSKK